MTEYLGKGLPAQTHIPLIDIADTYPFIERREKQIMTTVEPAALEQLRKMSLDEENIAQGFRVGIGRRSYIAQDLMDGNVNIWGDFGIEMGIGDSRDEFKCLAVCGFVIIQNDLYITQSPQGQNPEYMDNRQKKFFSKHNHFRTEILKALIELAKKLGIKTIFGFPARSHFKIITEQIGLKRGMEIMDDVYVSVSMYQQLDGLYRLDL